MIIKKQEDLSKHVTIRIGGVAESFYIPENVEELKALIKEQKIFHIIGGGSNLLIHDKCIFHCIISMEKCCSELIRLEENKVYAGASVRIQNVIRTVNSWELGGIEYLYSLPAFFGGIVYMNAGRGADQKCISDKIVSVHYLNENGEVCEMYRESCEFSYRKSIFQQKKWVILGAVLELEPVTEQQAKDAIAARMEQCRKSQDMRYPNFGSLFSKSSSRIMRMLQKLSVSEESKKSACLSSRNANWVINCGNGTFQDVMKIINRVKWLHNLARKQCEVEVIIWEQ